MNVPGLELFQGFVAQQFQRQLVGQLQRLLFNIPQASEGKCHTQSAQIPQPVRSQCHNLADERNFLRLKVDDESTRILSCEHFPAYGSRWHSLTYFRGNENLPQLALPLVQQLAQLPVIQTLGEPLRWKMTLNYYQRKTEQLFPFHTDIASNGTISAITGARLLPGIGSSLTNLRTGWNGRLARDGLQRKFEFTYNSKQLPLGASDSFGYPTGAQSTRVVPITSSTMQ